MSDLCCKRCGNSPAKEVVVAGASNPQLIPVCLRCIDVYRHEWNQCGNCKNPCENIYTVRTTEAPVRVCPLCVVALKLKVCGCGGVSPEDSFRFGICPSCIDKQNNRNDKFFYSDFLQIGSPASTTKEVFELRPFGVELESSSTLIRKGMTKFSAVHDGSISGQEFVSPILHGDAGAEVIKELCGLNPSYNEACGLHVHLNAKDLNWWQVLQIARGYTLVQGILFDMVASSRKGNRHCKAIETPYFLLNTKEQILGTLYSSEGDVRKAMKKKRIDKRYEFLNTHAYFYLGTIEIRLHEGTFEYPDIIGWVNLNQALFKYFLHTPVHEDDNPFDHFDKAISPYAGLKDYVLERLARFKHGNMAGLLRNPKGYPSIDIENDLKPKSETLYKYSSELSKLLQALDMNQGNGKPMFHVNRVFKQIKDQFGIEVGSKKEELKSLEQSSGIEELSHRLNAISASAREDPIAYDWWRSVDSHNIRLQEGEVPYFITTSNTTAQPVQQHGFDGDPLVPMGRITTSEPIRRRRD